MILQVTDYGEPILRKKGVAIDVFDKKLKKLASDMVETMRAENGAGLAAQQVGMALCLFVLDISSHEDVNEIPFTLDGLHPPLDLLMPMTFINAKVTILRGGTVMANEGCLSFPGIEGDVERADNIRCEYQDVDGAKHVLEASDWLARVVQHEYDHTQGVLFIDRMDESTLHSLNTRLKRLRKSSRSKVTAGHDAKA